MNTSSNKQILKEDNEEKNYFILDKENSIVYKVHAKSSEEAMRTVIIAAYEDEREDDDNLPEIDYNDYDNKGVIKLIKYILDKNYNAVSVDNLQIVSQEELDNIPLSDIDSVYLVDIDSEDSRFEDLDVEDYIGKNVEECTIEVEIPDWWYDKADMEPEYVDKEDLGDGDVELYFSDKFYSEDCDGFVEHAKQAGCSHAYASDSTIELTGTIKVLKDLIAEGEGTDNYTSHTLYSAYWEYLDGELPSKVELGYSRNKVSW